jgi:amino acid transporter
MTNSERSPNYRQGSLSLAGTVAVGTGVMIGAGIFALTGQLAEQAGGWFPLAFLVAAVVTAFSAYAYVKMSNAYPSAGGIAMYLQKAYGPGAVTAVCALLMYFSMVINESLVARTFGTYTLQLFDMPASSVWVTALGLALLAFAFLANVLGNRFITRLEMVTAAVKIGGILVFALAGLWLSGFSVESIAIEREATTGGFLAAVALGILAYKGFTTITNSGSEIVDPHRNLSRAIVTSIGICVVLYALVALAVAGNLSLGEIIAARDFALAEAARPALGDLGLWFTVVLAIVATVSGVIASTFAVSRMLAMLTDMKLVPHSHFGMPGSIQRHTLVYTVVLAMLLTILFDLSRIASLGAIFYIVMDIAVQWGVLRYIRQEVGASAAILATAILLDGIVLGALLLIKWQSDPLVVWVSAAGIAAIVIAERLFLRMRPLPEHHHDAH